MTRVIYPEITLICACPSRGSLQGPAGANVGLGLRELAITSRAKGADQERSQIILGACASVIVWNDESPQGWGPVADSH
jgi:hypothetical protein